MTFEVDVREFREHVTVDVSRQRKNSSRTSMGPLGGLDDIALSLRTLPICRSEKEDESVKLDGYIVRLIGNELEKIRNR